MEVEMIRSEKILETSGNNGAEKLNMIFKFSENVSIQK